MSYGRRARDISVNVDAPPYATSSSATSATQRRAQTTQRQNTASSQPASAYFSSFAGAHDTPQPTPDAPAHFAYSTTLRRNPEEHLLSPRVGAGAADHLQRIDIDGGPKGVWERVAGMVKGERAREGAVENGHAQAPTEETAAAKFAMLRAEVRRVFAAARDLGHCAPRAGPC
jgi:Ca2+-transporting ATPase